MPFRICWGVVAWVSGGLRWRSLSLRKIADLQVQLAELERRGEELKANLRDQVLTLLLTWEQREREIESLRFSDGEASPTRLLTHQQGTQLLEIDYRLGNGSTEQMLNRWQQDRDLTAQLETITINRNQTHRKLVELVHFSF